MTKTQYYTATTLDGYIADENNSLSWLFESDSGPDSFKPLQDRFGNPASVSTGKKYGGGHE